MSDGGQYERSPLPGIDEIMEVARAAGDALRKEGAQNAPGEDVGEARAEEGRPREVGQRKAKAVQAAGAKPTAESAAATAEEAGSVVPVIFEEEQAQQVDEEKAVGVGEGDDQKEEKKKVLTLSDVLEEQENVLERLLKARGRKYWLVGERRFEEKLKGREQRIEERRQQAEVELGRVKSELEVWKRRSQRWRGFKERVGEISDKMGISGFGPDVFYRYIWSEAFKGELVRRAMKGELRGVGIDKLQVDVIEELMKEEERGSLQVELQRMRKEFGVKDVSQLSDMAEIDELLNKRQRELEDKKQELEGNIRGMDEELSKVGKMNERVKDRLLKVGMVEAYRGDLSVIGDTIRVYERFKEIPEREVNIVTISDEELREIMRLRGERKKLKARLTKLLGQLQVIGKDELMAALEGRFTGSDWESQMEVELAELGEKRKRGEAVDNMRVMLLRMKKRLLEAIQREMTGTKTEEREGIRQEEERGGEKAKRRGESESVKDEVQEEGAEPVVEEEEESPVAEEEEAVTEEEAESEEPVEEETPGASEEEQGGVGETEEPEVQSESVTADEDGEGDTDGEEEPEPTEEEQGKAEREGKEAGVIRRLEDFISQLMKKEEKRRKLEWGKVGNRAIVTLMKVAEGAGVDIIKDLGMGDEEAKKEKTGKTIWAVVVGEIVRGIDKALESREDKELTDELVRSVIEGISFPSEAKKLGYSKKWRNYWESLGDEDRRKFVKVIKDNYPELKAARFVGMDLGRAIMKGEGEDGLRKRVNEMREWVRGNMVEDMARAAFWVTIKTILEGASGNQKGRV